MRRPPAGLAGGGGRRGRSGPAVAAHRRVARRREPCAGLGPPAGTGGGGDGHLQHRVQGAGTNGAGSRGRGCPRRAGQRHRPPGCRRHPGRLRQRRPRGVRRGRADPGPRRPAHLLPGRVRQRLSHEVRGQPAGLGPHSGRGRGPPARRGQRTGPPGCAGSDLGRRRHFEDVRHQGTDDGFRGLRAALGPPGDHLQGRRDNRGARPGRGRATPLLDAALPQYREAADQGLGELDAAALYRHLTESPA